ncbi:CHAT domain-containing protein [Nostoc sp. FACHB-145]|uniref:CHAT domain-containing protein n=1 Tax=Nostoc sp. FACHB-145 TaxID=2692836 RepID=UPI0016857E78|nr:CHAT domain-containing protein [Nostoc sp. FACHB-145]MBD2472378.1 CHAT domain-containing protein [Nostoc sp. FACHB-145]
MTALKKQNAKELYNLGWQEYWQNKNYEAALFFFEQALEIDPKNYKIWNAHGNSLRMLGRNYEAIDSFKKGLEIKEDYKNLWNNYGLALEELDLHIEAIKKYNQALIISHYKYYQGWHNRGNSLKSLGDYKQAISSYDRALELKKQYWRAWRNRGWALFFSDRYQEAIENWNNGLQSLQPNIYDYQEGCGQLHYSKGNAQYLHGQQQEVPFPSWKNAVNSYEKALNFLTFDDFPEHYLTVLQSLIKVYRSLDEKDKAQALELEGSESLGRILLDKPDIDKIRLSRKFAAFDQYRVDSFAQLGDWEESLNLAEKRKNLCLRWLRDNRWVEPTEIDTCQATPLLNAQTAVIYWHISPSAITTFILKYNQPVIGFILTADTTIAGSDKRLQNFEDWVRNWKSLVEIDFKINRSKFNELLPGFNELLPDTLPDLAKILDISAILSKLEGINHLILIPHRDLHLLPLHALFPDNFTITYLPSIQIGVDLQQSPVTAINELPFLSVEHPETLKSQDKVKTFDETSLLYAEIESAAITQIYKPAYRLAGAACTLDALINALQNTSGILHFTGHAYHNIKNPSDSALLLVNTEQLKLKDIFYKNLNFSHYNLICLSACETGKTSKQGLIDEFVGLSAGFLSAGASCIVSTLWKVDEISAALLMIRFYQLLQQLPPSVALKQAQMWLRDATYDTLAQWCLNAAQQLANYSLIQSENLEDAAAIFQEMADKIDFNHRPYAHPYYWAAFTITGNVNHDNSKPQ